MQLAPPSRNLLMFLWVIFIMVSGGLSFGIAGFNGRGLRFGSGHQLDIGLIDFDRHRAHDQIERDNDSALFLAPADDTFQPLQWTAADPDAAPGT